MDSLDDILSSAQGGQLIANLAQRFGLSDEQMESAVTSLAPALRLGLNNAADEPSVLEKLIGLLAAPDRHGGFDDDNAAHADDSVAQGRALLEDLFGSSDKADQVVQLAARQSGVGSDILSQLLPVLASVLLGGLFKSVNNQGLGGILGQLANSGVLGDVLGQVLGGGRSPQPGQTPPGGGPFDGGMGGGMGPGGGLGRAPGGGLGGLLGGILGSLLGGRRAPPGGPGGGMGGGSGGGYGRGGGPLDADSGMGGGSGPGGLPEGIDAGLVKDAIEQIQKTLQVGKGGQSGSGNSGGQSDLENLLSQVLGKRSG